MKAKVVRYWHVPMGDNSHDISVTEGEVLAVWENHYMTIDDLTRAIDALQSARSALTDSPC